MITALIIFVVLLVQAVLVTKATSVLHDNVWPDGGMPGWVYWGTFILAGPVAWVVCAPMLIRNFNR